ncbi:MAG: hypothetical protein FJW35_01030 [Acidobacteria bacterium]|nr:hypothetical protein [Acidobacteriota bacterium]
MVSRQPGRYRILAFDGGGIRGLCAAVWVRRLEDKLPGVLDRVDLFAGTSTGAVIALALAAKLQPGELVDLISAQASAVFDDSWLDDLRDFGRLIGAQYDSKNLQKVLSDVFGANRLGDLDKKVVIPAFQLDNRGREAEVLSQLPRQGFRLRRADRRRGAAVMCRPDLLPILSGIHRRRGGRQQPEHGGPGPGAGRRVRAAAAGEHPAAVHRYRPESGVHPGGAPRLGAGAVGQADHRADAGGNDGCGGLPVRAAARRALPSPAAAARAVHTLGRRRQSRCPGTLCIPRPADPDNPMGPPALRVIPANSESAADAVQLIRVPCEPEKTLTTETRDLRNNRGSRQTGR